MMESQPRLMSMTDADRTASLAGQPEAVADLLIEAAEVGHAEAQLLAGQIYLDGTGMVRNATEALRWFGLAAQSGNAMAMNMVGRCCDHGWGTVVDKGLAAQWYQFAVDRKLDWAMYNLATLYTLGDGISQDREEALRLFERAAAMGHAKSITMVGSFHEDGWVVPRDLAKAAELYQRAAEAGDLRGQFNHAPMRIDEGDLQGTAHWIHVALETATPAFGEKIRLWLESQSASEWFPDLERLLHR